MKRKNPGAEKRKSPEFAGLVIIMVGLAVWTWADLLAVRAAPEDEVKSLVCQGAGQGFVIREQKGGAFSDADPACPEAVKYLIGRPLDLNRASAEELALLPGIGPKSAERIVTARAQVQGFNSLEEVGRTPRLFRPALESLQKWAYVKTEEVK